MLNSVRSAFASWQDRLVLVAGIAILLAGARAWFADHAWTISAAVVAAAGGAGGLSAGRLIASRLTFHTTDGPLAADALQPQMRQRYTFAWHCIALAAVAIATAVVAPALAGISLASYAAGAVLAGATDAFSTSKSMGGALPVQRTLQTWLQRPSAAAISAALLILTLALPGIERGSSAMFAVTSVGAALVVLPLTSVDHQTVRFLTISGHGAWRIVGHQARGAILFLILAAPAVAILADPTLAAMVMAAAAAALLLMSVRILAYRIYPKRSANFIVSILCAFLLFVAFSLPIFAPILSTLLIWRLLRRAAPKTWLLA